VIACGAAANGGRGAAPRDQQLILIAQMIGSLGPRSTPSVWKFKRKGRTLAAI